MLLIGCLAIKYFRMKGSFVSLWKKISNNRKELCPRISNNCWILFLLIVADCFNMVQAQTFALDVKSDSLALLTLTDGASTDTWRLPYPTYAFATADVDGDGLVDALVGVIKPTRFDPRNAPRLFVFRNVHGRIRPLWLGSRLCGELHNFRTAPPPASPPTPLPRRGEWSPVEAAGISLSKVYTPLSLGEGSGVRPSTSSPAEVITLERDRHGTWFVGRYAWQSFGFTQVATLISRASRPAAEAVFLSQP